MTEKMKDYERLRTLSYQNCDVVVMCYCIDNPDSLANVIEQWHPEIKYFCPKAPIILVGKMNHVSKFTAINFNKNYRNEKRSEK